MNLGTHHYLQQIDDSILAKQFAAVVKDKLLKQNKNPDAHIDQQKLAPIVALLKERATFVADLWDQGDFFFITPDGYDEKASIVHFESDEISKKMKDWIVANDLGFGRVMMPLRLALVGEMKGPDVFVIMSLLGKEESILRIQKAIDHIDQK